MWVRVAGPPRQRIIVFDYDASRSSEVAARLLEGAHGVIQSDGYGAYDQVAKHNGLVHCGCIAHARRKFFEAIKALPKKEQKTPTAAHEAVRRIDELYKIERESSALRETERTAARQEKAIPLLESLHERRQGQRAPLQPSADRAGQRTRAVCVPTPFVHRATGGAERRGHRGLAAVQVGRLDAPVVGKKIEPRREARIIDEIIVDAHTDDERAMSWYYYLESELRFPFEAECIKQWPISPLRKGEKIRVTGLASTQHCVHQIVVRGRWGRRSLGVPLAQLKLVGTDKATAQAIADWHYWVARENAF